MGRFNYNGPREYEPLGAWNYFWLSVLYSIPVIGFIFLIIHSISRGNYNRRSYARSFFCLLILIGIIALITIAIGAATAGMSGIIDKIKDLISQA